MSAKHTANRAPTPGPWEVRDWKSRTLKFETNLAVHGADNHMIAGFGIGGFQTAADARLIAAAPDLLEALVGILRLNGSRLDRDLVVAADAAIAKARGTP